VTFIPGLSRAVPVAAAALGCALLAGPALAKNNPPATPAPGAAANAVITVDAVRDSVTIGGLAAGPATVEVLRSGVVIGVYSDNVEASRPLTVNTVEPTATKPSGDCWERGVLPVGLTPDIRPLDVVSVVGGPTVTVPADAPTAAAGIPGGPLGGCSAIAAFAANAVQSASPPTVISGSGADLALSGAAQPLATAVSVSVGDGRVSTAAVAGVLTGTRWAATIPAAALEGLANGTLTATARYTVPDVSSGAPSQIEGAPLTVTKVPAPAVSAGGAVQPVAATPDATVPTIARPSSARPVRLGRLVTSSRLSLAAARRTGIRATFVVPAGARIARLELRRGSRTVVARTISVRGGARHVVRLSGAHLTKGAYRLVIRVGASRRNLGPATTKQIRIV